MGQIELILENRQVLLIFFVIVALCGVFFSMGYLIGHNTLSSSTVVAQAAPEAAGDAEKPSPMPPPAYLQQGQRLASNIPESPPSTTELSFYESVEENPLRPRSFLPMFPPPPPAILSSFRNRKKMLSCRYRRRASWFRVSALTRREDAEALLTLLQERDLPVLVTSSRTDPLFHVVVGPYDNEQDAQEAKVLLEYDGFRPIIKR